MTFYAIILATQLQVNKITKNLKLLYRVANLLIIIKTKNIPKLIIRANKAEIEPILKLSYSAKTI